MLKSSSIKGTASESKTHKLMKLLLHEKLLESNSAIETSSIEKYIEGRFADIYFKMKDGRELVIEVQNSNISINEIKGRTNDYNQKRIYVLWILNGKGSCSFSNKFPIDQNRLKVSPAELFLHRMYGGRVYYFNFGQKKKEKVISELFALHFSKTFSKKYRQIFKTKFGNYYLRDTYVSKIRDMQLLVTTFGNYKIGRFYDKSVMNRLKEQILLYIIREKIIIVNKKELKGIYNKFKKRFGKFIIYSILLNLSDRKKFLLSRKVSKKLRIKVGN